MPNLSDGWNQPDYEQDAPLPADSLPAFQGWQRNIGAPILGYVQKNYGQGAKVSITSAYRPVAANTAAGGAAHSQHEAIGGCCAVDFTIYADAGYRITNLKPVFDWIRLTSGLPVDELIWEHVMVQQHGVWVTAGHDILHASYVVGMPRRIAKEGESSNLVPYTSWPFTVPTVVPPALESAVNEG